MTDKDKKNTSPRKWWRSLVSISLKFPRRPGKFPRWLGKFSRWLAFTEMGWFLIFLFVETIVISGFFYFYGSKSKNFEFARTFTLAIGAVGGAYGLILAARRSAKFSEQVDTGQKQLFNEQLGRGAELLANEGIVMRQTGIRVLGNLAERTINEPEQVKLIMQIIHDFVRSQAKHPSNDEGAEDKEAEDKEAEDKEAEDKEAEDKGDIEISIRTLGSLYNKLGQPNDLKELIDFSECYLVGLNFTETELQGADFWATKLQGAHFRAAKLQEARFIGAKLQGAHFRAARLQGAIFIGAKLQEADFKGAKLQCADCTLANFSNAEDLKEDQIKGMIFHAKNQPTLPKDLEQFLDKRRGYEFKEDPDDKSNRRRFVKSDAEWSEKRVDQWVDKYLTSIRDPEDAS